MTGEFDRVSPAVGKCSHRNSVFATAVIRTSKGLAIGNRIFGNLKSGPLGDSVHIPFPFENRFEIMG